MIRNNHHGLSPLATLAILFVAPLALGAKGCSRAVVGDEAPCQGTSCEVAGEDGMTGGSTGTGTGTGGSGAKGGASATGGTSGGTATGGTGTGGTSGGTATGGTGTGGASGSTATGGTGTGGASGSTATGGTGTGGSGGQMDLGCGAREGDNCADGDFCKFAPEAICGRGDANGTCTPKPDVCDDLYHAVCACDGMTYANECFANMAGTSADTDGACPTGDTCGGITGKLCGDGQFCDFAPTASCGSADQTGSCEATPNGCTKDLNPVCGCDNQTYDNACLANAAGVSVASSGACGATPDFCGGIAGVTCPDGQYCTFPANAMCGGADMGGTCVAKPDGCTTDYTPVCGCDSKTYSNACEAARAGVIVRASDACPTN